MVYYELMTTSTAQRSTLIIKHSASDERIVACKGSGEKILMVTETLGFMCMTQRFVELQKMRFLPLWRRRVLGFWTDEKDEALAAFEEYAAYAE